MYLYTYHTVSHMYHKLLKLKLRDKGLDKEWTIPNKDSPPEGPLKVSSKDIYFWECSIFIERLLRSDITCQGSRVQHSFQEVRREAIQKVLGKTFIINIPYQCTQTLQLCDIKSTIPIQPVHLLYAIEKRANAIKMPDQHKYE